jgi:hypothetical protein
LKGKIMKIEICSNLLENVAGYLEENGWDVPETKEEWSEYIEDCIRQSTDNID